MTNPNSNPQSSVSGAELQGYADTCTFLDWLSGEDSSKFAFKTLPEAADSQALPRSHFGSCEATLASLVDENKKGAGAFFCVNQTLNESTKDSDIASVRAFFLDLDGGVPIEPVLESVCPPHAVVVSSPGKYHAYWKVSGCPVSDFKKTQLAIAARFCGDSAVSNPARLMRLPNFLHQKGDEAFRSHFLTELADGSKPRYADPDLVYAPERLWEDLGLSTTTHDLSFSPEAKVKEGERNDHLYKLGASYAGQGFEHSAILSKLEEANDQLDSPLENTEVRKIAKNAAKLPANDSSYDGGRASFIDIDEWKVSKQYIGKAPDEKWLVNKVIPTGQPVVLAAQGGIGKSMMALRLALDVAAYGLFDNSSAMFFGHPVMEGGSVVYFTAEESKDVIHRRLEAIDADNRWLEPKVADRLRVIPVADAGGAFMIGNREGQDNKSRYSDIRRKLRSIADLKLVVIDPLRSFAASDLNSSEHAQNFMTEAVRLAAATGAAVLILHHVNKDSNSKSSTPGLGRDMIRGSSAIVDGARCVIHMKPLTGALANKVRAATSDSSTNNLIQAGVVKANGRADTAVHYLRQNDNGLPVDITGKYRDGEKIVTLPIEDMLYVAIQRSYDNDTPLTATGRNGLFERRESFPIELKTLPKRLFSEHLKKLLEAGSVVKAKSSKSRVSGGKILMTAEQYQLEQDQLEQ